MEGEKKSHLTEEQRKENKAKCKTQSMRQDLKSHCTKIREGIRKNGSTSGIRAIWELFQNAVDLSDSAKIEISVSKNDFVFKHMGEPFTYDSLCSLVKQVSSQEKEDDSKVGQYGTGFLTTHTFSRKIKVSGSMLISEEPEVYVDVDEFVIDRQKFDDIPAFIEDMEEQILKVDALMDAPEATVREWTTLCYKLDEGGLEKVQQAIDEAIKLMPYVFTFNDKIQSCKIMIEEPKTHISFIKELVQDCEDGLKLCRINQTTNDQDSSHIDCYYLELHGGESRIILPLKNKNDVYSMEKLPHLFVYYPLIPLENENYFGVNFIFHSHKFTPEESRDNIIVPRGNVATASIANENESILDEMTKHLWSYLETHVKDWNNTIDMASLHIVTDGHSEEETKNFYERLRADWVAEFTKLKLINIRNQRYNFSEESHPKVLEKGLVDFLSQENKDAYFDALYEYAQGVALIPSKEELLRWSKIVNEWKLTDDFDAYLSLESIAENVNKKGESNNHLLSMLKMIHDTGNEGFFAKYALLPNREMTLRKREELRDAEPIGPDLYELVKALSSEICRKMVHLDYAKIVNLTPYNGEDLRSDLNNLVKKKEDECWNNKEKPKPYDGDFEKHLIKLCSSFTTEEGNSKRDNLMPIICKFEKIDYERKCIPALQKDDSQNIDLWRNIFASLVENQMKKIETKDSSWVENNIDYLVKFVDSARGDDFKNFCTNYAIYPNMNGGLCRPEDLKRNDGVKDERLIDIYNHVTGNDFNSECVNEKFETFYDKFQNDDHKYTPQDIAHCVNNKLKEGEYKDRILLEIIELTEQSGEEGNLWQIWFDDIYKERAQIRYNLGTEAEHKAINRILRKNKPELLEKLADISERTDAEKVIKAIDDAIANEEWEARNKMLGDYVEKAFVDYLEKHLESIGVSVRNEQGGQDIILSKEGHADYFLEIKSRWSNDQSVLMSQTQFRKAVENKENYALASVNMFNSATITKDSPPLELIKVEDQIKILTNVGELEKELLAKVDEVYRTSEDIHVEGSYGARVPQKVFDANPTNLAQFTDILIKHFTKNGVC